MYKDEFATEKETGILNGARFPTSALGTIKNLPDLCSTIVICLVLRFLPIPTR